MSDMTHHFFGVVESVDDPLKMNRVKVRVFGKHENSTELDESSGKGIPTEDLPWAIVAMPTTGSGMHGFGQSPHGLVEGSWVWGVSRDGPLYNELVVLAVLLGKPTKENPNPNDPMQAFFGKDGQWPDKEFIGKSDVNRHARGDLGWVDDKNLEPESDWVGWDKNKKVDPKGSGRKEWDFAPIPVIKEYELVKNIPIAGGGTWEEKKSPYAAEYPHNKILYDGPSRTMLEIDETPGKERISEWHGPSHTYREVHPDGTTQTKIRGDNYLIVIKDNYMWVIGDLNISAYGNINIMSDNSNIKIHASKGNIDLKAAKGIINMNTGQSKIGISADKSSISVKSEAPLNLKSSTKVNVSAKSVNIGSGHTKIFGKKLTVSTPSVSGVKKA